MPVQPESGGSSARYSCAVRPMEAAFTRRGRSLLTRTTSSPSAARLRATDSIRVSLSPSRKPGGSTWGSAWFSSTRMVPPRSPTGRSASRRPCVIRRSSRCRSAWRAKKPSSGWWRLASSSVMTTTGRTTRCSANRPMAAGSASSTLVSRTYVRRRRWLRWLRRRGCRNRCGYCCAALSGGQKNWPLVLPWAPGKAPHSDTVVSARPGRPTKGRSPALRSSRLCALATSSRMSRAFPAGGDVPPIQL